MNWNSKVEFIWDVLVGSRSQSRELQVQILDCPENVTLSRKCWCMCLDIRQKVKISDFNLGQVSWFMAFQDHNVSVLNYKTLQVYLKTPSGSKVRWPVVVSNILLLRNKKKSVCCTFFPAESKIRPSEWNSCCCCRSSDLDAAKLQSNINCLFIIESILQFFSVFNFNCVFVPLVPPTKPTANTVFFTKRFVWTRLRWSLDSVLLTCCKSSSVSKNLDWTRFTIVVFLSRMARLKNVLAVKGMPLASGCKKSN